MQLLDLGRGKILRLLQAFRGGYTPFASSQQIGNARHVFCSGTEWRKVPLSDEQALGLLKSVRAACESKTFQVKMAGAAARREDASTRRARAADRTFPRLPQTHFVREFAEPRIFSTEAGL